MGLDACTIASSSGPHQARRWDQVLGVNKQTYYVLKICYVQQRSLPLSFDLVLSTTPSTRTNIIPQRRAEHENMADKEQEGASTGGYAISSTSSTNYKSHTLHANHFPRLLRGYLASAKSYIPGMGQVSDTASSGAGKAQEGLGAAGYVPTCLTLF